MGVEEVYAGYRGLRGEKIRELRALVLDVAVKTEGVGQIEECLKWGQPSFVTVKPKSGSTIRIDAVNDSETKYAMYFICNTNLVSRFRDIYPDKFEYSGNRAVTFVTSHPVPEEELRHCIAMALTYHV
ncbi:MAG: DUF1801 domain-containing protein [Pseudomonadota bacterium]